MSARAAVRQRVRGAIRRLLWGAVLCASCAGLPGNAEAVTYLVRKTGGTGADATCQTVNTACRTIQAAENIADDDGGTGDTIYVGAGTYAEDVTLSAGGASGNHFKFIADTTGAQTGDAGNVIVGTTTGGFSASGISYVTIRDFWITGATGTDDGISWSGLSTDADQGTGGSDNLLIDSCKIFGNADTGITGTGGNASSLTHDVKIQNSEIFGNGASGIFNNGGDNWTITNNTLYGNGGSGIELNRSGGTTDPSPGTLSHNVIFGNASYGINGDTGTTWTVKNNLIYKNGNHGIFLRLGSASVYAQYWMITNNTIDDNAASGIFFAHSTAVDPGHTFQDNIITNNDTYGIERSATAADNSTYSRNDVALNATAAYSNVTPDAGSIITDPKFVGALTDGSGSWALDFDNSADLVNVADNAALELSAPLTVEAWVRPDTLAAGDGIVDRWAASPNRVFSMQRAASTNAVRVLIDSNGTSTATECDVTSAAVMRTGAWNHVAFSLSGTTVYIAVNGVVVSGSCAAPYISGSSSLQIGGNRPGSYFDGLIDGVRVSNSARYTANFIPPRHLAVDANTVALWWFNEGSGQDIYDKSTNAIDGTLGATSGASSDDPTRVSTDPAFNARLQLTATGHDSPDSPCDDVGSQTASAAGLDAKTIRLDSVVDSGTVDLGFHYPTSTLVQNAYRWYDNTNALQPVTATAAENTAITDVGSGAVKRLRLSIQGAGETAPSGLLLKLQYAQMSGAACDGVGETFADIGAVGSGTIWRAADNAFDGISGNTGKTISAGLLTPTDVFGFYTEAAQTAAGPSAFAAGQDGEYDWVVQQNNATVATSYCFRVVYQGGGPLSTYTNYPKATTTADTITVSGKLYSDEGTTQITTAKTIKLSVNGAAPQSATNGVSGYSFSVVAAFSGDVYTLFVDGDAVKAVTVTRGNGANISNVDLWQNRLVARHEDAGPITNTNLGQYDKDNDAADILFTSNAGAFTCDGDASYTGLCVDNSLELHVATGDTFTPGGKVKLASGGSSPGGDLHVIGTLSMEGNNLTVNGGDATGAGTITQTSSGTTTLDAAGSLGGGAYTFYNLTLGDGSGVTTTTLASGGTLTVSNDLVVSASQTLALNSISLAVNGGDITGTGTILCGATDNTCAAGTVTLDAAGNLDGGTYTFYNLTLGDGSGATTTTLQTGTYTVKNDLVVSASQTLALNSISLAVNGGDITGTGTILCGATDNTCSAGTVTLDGAGNIDGGTYTFYNLTLGDGSGATTTTLQAGTYDVYGDLTVSANQTLALNSLDLTVRAGDVLGTGTILCGATDNTCAAGTVVVTGTPAGAWGAGTYAFYHLAVHGDGSTTTLGNDLTVKGTLYVGGDGNASIGASSHTLDTASKAVTAGAITIAGTTTTNAVLNANASAISTGSLTMGLTNGGYSYYGTLNAGSATITLSGTGTPLTINTGTDLFNAQTSTIVHTHGTSATVKATTYNHLQFNGAGTYTLPAGTLPVNDLTLTQGTVTAATNNPAITISGSLSLASGTTYTKGSGTTTFNGTTAKTWTDSTASKQDLGTVVLDKTNATTSNNKITLASSVKAASVTIDGDNQADTLDLAGSGYTLTLTGSGTPLTIESGGTLTPNTDSYVNYASASGANVTAATYAGLQISGSGTFVLGTAGSQTITTSGSGILNVTSGTIDATTWDPAVNINGSGGFGAALLVSSGAGWTKSDTASITFAGTNVQSWSDANGTKVDMGRVVIDNSHASGVIIASGVKTQTMTINVSRKLDISGQTLTLTGTGTPLAITGTLTEDATSTVEFAAGSGTITVNSRTYGGNLKIGAAGTYNAAGDITVTSDVTVNTGWLAMGANSLTVNGGDLGVTGIFTQTASGTVTMKGTSATGLGGAGNTTCYNLTIGDGTTSSSITAAGLLNVSNVLTITASTGTNTFDGSSRTITLQGSGTPFVIGDATEVFTASTSTVNYTGSSATNVAATTYNHLGVGTTSDGGAAVTYTLAGNTTVSGTLTVGHASSTNTDVLAASNRTLTFTGTGTPFTITSKGDFDEGTSTVKFNRNGTETISVASTTYYKLALYGQDSANNGPAYQLLGAITTSFTGAESLHVAGNDAFHEPRLDTNGYAVTVNGELRIGSGLTLIGALCPRSSAIEVKGNFSCVASNHCDIDGLGGYCGAANTSTVTLSGTADQTVTMDTGQAFYNLVLNNTGISGSDDIIVSGNLDIDNDLTVTDGDLDLSTNDPNVTLAGSLAIGAAGSVDTSAWSGTWTFDGTTAKTWTDSSSGGPQTLGAVTLDKTNATTSNNKITLGSSVKAASLTIDGDNQADTLDLADSGYTMTLTGAGTPLTIEAGGTLTANTNSKVAYVGTSATNVASATYDDLDLGNGGSATTYTAAGNLTLTGILTVDTGDTLAAGSYTLIFNGSGVASGSATPFVLNGSFTAGTSTVSFRWDSTDTITIPGTTYNVLELRTSANSVSPTYQPNGNLIVTSASSQAVYIYGSHVFSIPTLDLTATNYSLDIQNGGIQIGAGGVGVSGGMNARGSTITIAGNFNLDSGSFTQGTSVMTVGGNFTIGAPFTGNGGSVTLTGASKNWTNSDGTIRDVGDVTISGTIATTTSVKAKSVTINNTKTLDISGDTLTLTGTGTPLTVTGTLTENTTSTVEFAAASSTTTIPARSYGGNITVSGAGTFDTGGNMTVIETLTASAGTFRVGTNHTVTAKNATINGGTFAMPNSGGMVKISGSGTLSMSSGTWSSSDVATAPQLTTSDTGTPTYVGVNLTGGTLNIAALDVDYLKNTGFVIDAGVTLTAFDKVRWGSAGTWNGQAGAPEILLKVTAQTKNLLNHVFPTTWGNFASGDCNVQASTSGIVTMWDWTGAYGGEEYDCDDSGGEVVWEGGASGTRGGSGTHQYPALY